MSRTRQKRTRLFAGRPATGEVKVWHASLAPPSSKEPSMELPWWLMVWLARGTLPPCFPLGPLRPLFVLILFLPPPSLTLSFLSPHVQPPTSAASANVLPATSPPWAPTGFEVFLSLFLSPFLSRRTRAGKLFGYRVKKLTMLNPRLPVPTVSYPSARPSIHLSICSSLHLVFSV